MAGQSTQSSEYFSSVRSEIECHLPATIGRILEIGCGTGATMGWIRRIRDVKFASGIEISHQAATSAASHFDEIINSPVDLAVELLSPDNYEMLLALDVLEHLERPEATLARLCRLVSDGGTVLISVPNCANYSVSWPLFFQGRWTYSDEGHLDRTHLRFFDKRSAIALLTDQGLSVRHISMTWKYPNLFSWLGLHSKRARWYSQRIARYVVPKHMCISQYVISANKPRGAGKP